MKETNPEDIEIENPIEENQPLIKEELPGDANFEEEEKEEEDDGDIKGGFLLDQFINKAKYIVLYNFKDFLFMVGLLMTPSFNFNYLYYPFLLCGIFYSILIKNNGSKHRKVKRIFNIIILIYSSLLLIFEIVIIAMSASKNKTINDKKTTFLDLGIPYLLKESAFDLVKTIFGPVLMIIICFIAFILEKNSNFKDEDVIKMNREKFKNLEMFYKKVKNYLFLSFFIIVAFATFNKSILTMVYLVLFYIVLTLLFIVSDEMLYIQFKNIIYIEIIFIACQLVIINISNTYSIADKYFNKRNEGLIYDFIANSWGQFGFYLAYYKEDDNYTPFIDWVGYFFGCFSFVCLIFMIKDIKNDIHENLKKQSKEKKVNGLNDKESEIDIIYEKNIFIKIFENIKSFCTGEYFLLNVIRILAILWIYYVRSFFSIVVIIWLFFSFLYLDPMPIRVLATFFLLPALYISLTCISSSRIFYSYYDDFDDKNKIKYLHFSLGNYDHDLINFFGMNIFYIIIICFIYFKPESKIINIGTKKEKISENKIEEKEEAKEPLLIKEDNNKKKKKKDN